MLIHLIDFLMFLLLLFLISTNLTNTIVLKLSYKSGRFFGKEEHVLFQNKDSKNLFEE